MHVAQSPKKNELNAYVATEKPDVVAITETWTNSTHLVSELLLPGYEIFQKNRTNKKEGGFICYVKSTLAAFKIDKQDAENYDSINVEITHNNKKLVLATFYRPAKLQAADDTALYDEIQSLIQAKNAIVVGDFNCANVDWRSLIGDQEGSRLISIVEDSFLTQAHIRPTRENILDLVIVSDPDLVRDCEAGEKLGGSDNNIIRFNVCVQHKLDDNPTLIPDYRKGNFSLPHELLPPTVWEYIYIRTSKRNYENQLARKVKINPKKFFTYIRSKKKVKANIDPLTDETRSWTKDSKHLAKILNSKFTPVLTTEDKNTTWRLLSAEGDYAPGNWCNICARRKKVLG